MIDDSAFRSFEELGFAFYPPPPIIIRRQHWFHGDHETKESVALTAHWTYLHDHWSGWSKARKIYEGTRYCLHHDSFMDAVRANK